MYTSVGSQAGSDGEVSRLGQVVQTGTRSVAS